MLAIYAVADHWGWHGTGGFAVQQTGIVFLQVGVLLQNPSFLVGDRGQGVGAIVNEVKITDDKDDWNREDCQYDEADAQSQTPRWECQKLLTTLGKLIK